MSDLIRRSDALAAFAESTSAMPEKQGRRRIEEIPAVDAVPWKFLERYADWFCAAVSMPEFIREAKAFYKSTNEAMKGGHIDG